MNEQSTEVFEVSYNKFLIIQINQQYCEIDVGGSNQH